MYLIRRGVPKCPHGFLDSTFLWSTFLYILSKICRLSARASTSIFPLICWALLMSLFWQDQICFIVLYCYSSLFLYMPTFQSFRTITFHRSRVKTVLLLFSSHTTHYNLLQIWVNLSLTNFIITFATWPYWKVFPLLGRAVSVVIDLCRFSKQNKTKQNKTAILSDNVVERRNRFFISDRIALPVRYRNEMRLHFLVSWAPKSAFTLI